MKKEIKKNKARITVELQTEMAKKVGDLMSGLDLGICGISPQIYEITFTTTTKVDKKYITKLEKTMQDNFLKADTPAYIKFVKVEIIKEI